MISDVITDRCKKVYESGSLGQEFWSKCVTHYQTQVRSLPCLDRPSRHAHFEFCFNRRIFKVVTWISLKCYMDLSKLLHGFVKVVTWICQICFMYYSHLAKKNQAEV